MIKNGAYRLCIHNSLPGSEVSFGLVICSMDDADIERAEKQKYLIHNMNEQNVHIMYIRTHIHIMSFINSPEIFIENTASYPTYYSQNRCPIIMTAV